MTLREYLMPGEEVRFRSKGNVHFASKQYQVILTDRRILLFAERGMLFKNDDIVTHRLDDLSGVKYSEQGLIGKTGTIRIQSPKTEMDLSGPANGIKALYQQIMQFM